MPTLPIDFHCRSGKMPSSGGLVARLASHGATSFAFGGNKADNAGSLQLDKASEIKMPPVMPLPPPPAAAAAQWAQHAYQASSQAAAARAAAAKAAEVASAQAAAAQAAATQAQVAQVSAQQAAAAQVAQSLGYNVAPVGVPTAAAYGDLPIAAPPYGLSNNPLPSNTLASSMGPWALTAAALAPSRPALGLTACRRQERLRANRASEFLVG